MAPRDMDDLQQQIHELFSDLWQVPRFSGARQGFRPQADSYRTDDPPELHIVVDLAWIDPQKIDIATAERTLLISGVRERAHVKGARVLQMELEYGPFQRRIQLPEDVDPTRASATYERGLLKVVLPIAPAPPPQERVAIVIRRIG
jgi:HSP20 family protein